MLSRYLLLHGSIVILAGLLSGFPYWLAIINNKEKEVVRAWRVAHSFLIANGMLMLLAGLAIPFLALDGHAVRILVWSMVPAGYGFVYAFIVGALKRTRGLTVRPYGLNTVLFAGHFIGASGSLVGIAILIYGCLKAM
jgi:uncharacterized membrane protein